MKLLSLKIGDIPESFRSLDSGFEIHFHDIFDNEAMENFRPFCFAGLNGSGKSNVLEALANIFYHLEICVARYLPDTIRDHSNFKREECSPDAFTLEYLIGQHNSKPYSPAYFHRITINKLVGKAPTMFISEYPFDDTVEKVPISMVPDLAINKPAPAKSYLPDQVIGYSSGENEILSLPFIKSRLVHLDEFKQATKAGEQGYYEPENSLIYIDNNMSQAVLLACMLFEAEETLKPIKDVEDGIGIQELRSFRININLQAFKFLDEQTSKEFEVPVLKIIENDQIQRLKDCATSWYTDGAVLWLDYHINEAMKEAFQKHFTTSFNLFQVFRLLYELNSHFITEKTKREVYRSKGFYTDGKLPVGSPEDDVFHFLDFKILKKSKVTGEVKELLLREFSDGEHQFLHTMGICLLLKDRRALLLLDEPETHFNPSWRAKFIKLLNESVTSGNKGTLVRGGYNIHYLKDIILTSHSPFIISDCLPNNVIFFNKNKESKKLEAKKASEIGINTYGSSVDYILKNVFKTKMISSQSYEELKELISEGSLDELRKAVDYFGESSEKQFLFRRIFELTDYKDDSQS